MPEKQNGEFYSFKTLSYIWSWLFCADGIAFCLCVRSTCRAMKICHINACSRPSKEILSIAITSFRGLFPRLPTQLQLPQASSIVTLLSAKAHILNHKVHRVLTGPMLIACGHCLWCSSSYDLDMEGKILPLRLCLLLLLLQDFLCLFPSFGIQLWARLFILGNDHVVHVVRGPICRF